MKATRIVLLASTITAVNIAKADHVNWIYIPNPSLDNRQCAFYTGDNGQWYAINKTDWNFDEQLFAVGLAKAGNLNVSINVGGSACGLPMANLFINN